MTTEQTTKFTNQFLEALGSMEKSMNALFEFKEEYNQKRSDFDNSMEQQDFKDAHDLGNQIATSYWCQSRARDAFLKSLARVNKMISYISETTDKASRRVAIEIDEIDESYYEEWLNINNLNPNEKKEEDETV